MQEENKQAAAPAVEPQNGAAPASELKVDTGPNYKEMYESLAKKHEQAEFTIKKVKTELKNTKKQVEESSHEDEDDSKDPSVSLVDAKLNELRKEMSQSFVEKALSEISDPDEKNLVSLIYKTRIVHSGYTESQVHADIQEARAIANRSVIEKKIAEVSNALKAKETIQSGNGSSGQPAAADNASARQLSSAEQSMMAYFDKSAKRGVRS